MSPDMHIMLTLLANLTGSTSGPRRVKGLDLMMPCGPMKPAHKFIRTQSPLALTPGPPVVANARTTTWMGSDVILTTVIRHDKI